jgi:hypothetical protein
MLDARADFRLGVAPPTNRLGHDAPFWFLAMDVADKAVFCHELRVRGRALGRIRPLNTPSRRR